MSQLLVCTTEDDDLQSLLMLLMAFWTTVVEDLVSWMDTRPMVSEWIDTLRRHFSPSLNVFP